MRYVWRSSFPDNHLNINIENYLKDQKVFFAHLQLNRKTMTNSNLWRLVLLSPLMTLKVFVSIYWQALRLFVKGVPFLGKDKKIN